MTKDAICGRGGQATADERLHAKFLLLERIRSRNNWTGSNELKSHLERHSSWAEHGTSEARSRTLDNWLREMRRLADVTGLFEYRFEAGNRIGYRSAGRDRLSIETACLSLMAERFLQPLLPLAHVQSDLQDVFNAAHARVNEHDATLGRNGDAVSDLLERISIQPRGYLLGKSQMAKSLVPLVTGAILKRSCIDAIYNGRQRRLHPYGLVYRDPKYYLLAVDDSEFAAGVNEDALVPKVFLCSRFESAFPSNVRNLVPEAFTLADHLESEPLGIPLPGMEVGTKIPIVLELRLFDADVGAFIKDLEEHPISPDQSIEQDPADPSVAMLVAPGVRITVELMNWLLARGDRIEVVGPAPLRQRVANSARAVLLRYANEDFAASRHRA